MDRKSGGSAKDWKAGKPVRVVRNCKGRKHNNYAPEEGNRYDGIYKVRYLFYDYIMCRILTSGPPPHSSDTIQTSQSWYED